MKQEKQEKQEKRTLTDEELDLVSGGDVVITGTTAPPPKFPPINPFGPLHW